MPSPRGKRGLVLKLACAGLSVATAGGLLPVAEGLVRVAMPQVNFQDTQRSLFRAHAFGQSVGWKPGASGVSFGQVVQIDAQGFRDLAGSKRTGRLWIILGDSVTFGVGVGYDATFAGMLQAKVPDVAVCNTAVVGYSLENYRDVLRSLLGQGKTPEHVLLFYCLNDIYGYFDNVPSDCDTIGQKCLGLLRQNSKLYILAKALLTDRSKSYFTYDQGFYSDAQVLDRAVKTLNEIQQMTKAAGSELTVVILPYEYQIRSPEAANLEPQHVLRARLDAQHIAYLDASDWFRSSGQDSRALYLYGDAMHFSPRGHAVLFAQLVEADPIARHSHGGRTLTNHMKAADEARR
jgi:lysophospholipase L1-like esterase